MASSSRYTSTPAFRPVRLDDLNDRPPRSGPKNRALRRTPPAALDGGSSRLQRIRAVAHEREREADDRPEQRILVAAAFSGEHPPVGVTQIGREEQVNPEKDRNPSRIDSEDERQSAERLVDHDDPGEPIRQPQGHGI